ncbi:MAG TPA: ammonium transporter [Armatimonadota bacterium]|jgi:Amt family ammonium transporter
MPQGINAGDTAYVLACAGLVMLMTPGLAFFYAGMVRSKNALGTIMQSFAALAVISLQWALFGYSLAFGADRGGLIGDFSFAFLRGVGSAPSPYAPTIPHAAFMLFQMMFAVITPALITGAFAERKRFTAYLLFMVLWATFVYDPVAHWVWGAGGWLNKMGALDFAGGTVVHISSGVTALVAAVMMGRRHGYGFEEMRPHNLTLTLLGTGLLWFGWFGFNGGSALAANGLAVSATVATHLAAAAGALGWMAAEGIQRRQCTALGAASGAVAGLVGITPAAGFVGPMAAAAIGLIVGVVCFLAVALKSRLGYDDSLDTFGVHGVGGTVGALLTGVFASAAIQAGKTGLLEGNAHQLLVQAIGVGATIAYSVVVSIVLLKLVDALLGLRVHRDEETLGLDLSQHGETAYDLAA